MPKVYSFLDNFNWQPEDMQEVMLMAADEQTSYSEAAKKWIQDNEEMVSSWVKDGRHLP
jgi:glycine betaine/proline transport system substrate-binding protein